MYNETMNSIFEHKKEFHKKRAKASFEQKVLVLVELQKLAIEAKINTNRPKAHEIVWQIPE